MESLVRISAAACRRSMSFSVAISLIVLTGLPRVAVAQLNRTLHNDGWILAAAHAPGLEGSIWRTDLWVRADTHGSGSVTLYFCRSNQDNTDATGYDVQFPDGNKIVYIEDVVEEYLGIGNGSWVGAMHYTSDFDVQVYARVYSISPDGTASYGQVIEGIPTSDMTLWNDHPDNPGTDEDQWMFAMKHTADNRYRVNIGVVNPTDQAAQFGVRLFDPTGNNPPGGTASEFVNVPPYSMVQLLDPFADVNGGDWSNYVVRVQCGTEGGGALAYASVVDNATNDAFFVRGVKFFRPDE